MATFGIDRVLFPVDYPYAPNAPGRAFLDGLQMAPAELEKLAYDNADKI